MLGWKSFWGSKSIHFNGVIGELYHFQIWWGCSAYSAYTVGKEYCGHASYRPLLVGNEVHVRSVMGINYCRKHLEVAHWELLIKYTPLAMNMASLHYLHCHDWLSEGDHGWLVVWNICYFSIQLGMSLSQVTNSNFSEGQGSTTNHIQRLTIDYP